MCFDCEHFGVDNFQKQHGEEPPHAKATEYNRTPIAINAFDLRHTGCNVTAQNVFCLLTNTSNTILSFRGSPDRPTDFVVDPIHKIRPHCALVHFKIFLHKQWVPHMFAAQQRTPRVVRVFTSFGFDFDNGQRVEENSVFVDVNVEHQAPHSFVRDVRTLAWWSLPRAARKSLDNNVDRLRLRWRDKTDGKFGVFTRTIQSTS